MKFKNTEIWGFEHAIRGMRNPKESWDKIDSWVLEEDEIDCVKCYCNKKDMDCGQIKDLFDIHCPNFHIGASDLKLMTQLIKAGSEHRKFLRQIFVSVDITAPLYWWKEFDTYKVGTTSNSTSTMHKLTSKPITLECFETDDMCDIDISYSFAVNTLIPFLEHLRYTYLELIKESNIPDIAPEEKKRLCKNAKCYWKELVRWLPESWLQTRTITMNYENIYTIIHQRKNHKLNEWSGRDKIITNFLIWARCLPYAEELLFWDFEKDYFEVPKEETGTDSLSEPQNIEGMPNGSTPSNVDHPSHYNQGGIECIDAMIAAYGVEAVKNFCKCNAFKYQWRFGDKNGEEDLKKAQWYQDKYMELDKNENMDQGN